MRLNWFFIYMWGGGGGGGAILANFQPNAQII